MTKFTIAAPTRNRLGEGPVWVARENAIYWVDIPGQKLHRHEPASGVSSSLDVPERMTCIAPRAGGGFVAAFASGFALLDDAADHVRWLARPELAMTTNRFNDGGADPAGRFYCGTMNETDRSPTGSMYRLEADGSATRVIEGVAVSNSTAWSPDGGIMYFCDTSERTIRAYRYDLTSGELGDARTFVAADAAAGKPDGSAVDCEGYVWNARWDGWGIARFAPDGSLDRFIELPVRCCTCCAFGGPDMKTLFVTSASEPLSDDEKNAQPHAGALLAIPVETPGLRKPEVRIEI